MNFKKLALLLIVLSSCASQKHVNITNKYHWFPFKWYSAKISGKQFNQLAMLVPAKVNNINANFIMQFDLGSDATSVYGNTLDSYYSSEKINSFLNKNAKYVSDAGNISYDTRNLSLFFGDLEFDSSIYKQNYGKTISKDSLFSTSEKLLGTIGSDVFKGKVLIIDYPNKRMCVLNKLDNYIKKNTYFVQARKKKRKDTDTLYNKRSDTLVHV